MVVRFFCVIRVPVCPRVSPCGAGLGAGRPLTGFLAPRSPVVKMLRQCSLLVFLPLASALKLSQLSFRPLESGRATSAACSAESLVGENGLVIFAIRRPG